jgi:hypothetical protein
MLSASVWVRRGLKVLLTGLIFVTAISLFLQEAMRRTKPLESGDPVAFDEKR